MAASTQAHPDHERLVAQAQAISQLLAEANVGACSIEEGVRRLLNRAEGAEARLQEQENTLTRLLKHFEAMGEVYPHDEELYALVKALASPRPVPPQPPTKVSRD